MEGTQIVELICSILIGLATCIPLVVKLIQTVKVATQEKNWEQLVGMAFEYMIEAEKKFESGATRKEWVMSMIKIAAKQINYNYDAMAEKSISDMIFSVFINSFISALINLVSSESILMISA